ncbi:MAG: hypothetical protein SF029_09530 [bacterium]|nr:hypothetical protein [bacterium]
MTVFTGKTLTFPQKLIFPITWIIITVGLVLAVKWVFTFWVSFHITVVVVIVLFVATTVYRPWKSYTKKSTYLILVLFLSVTPPALAFAGESAIERAVCLLHGVSSFHHFITTPVNQSVSVCGYIDGCSSAYFGEEQHVWEVCRFVDVTNPDQSVLVYTVDITINIDNQFVFTSLTVYPKGTLLAGRGKLVGSLNWGICTVDAFCHEETLPIAAIVLN